MDHTIILSGAIVDHQTWMTSLNMYVKGSNKGNLGQMEQE